MRFFGMTLDEQTKVVTALRGIYGIGISGSLQISNEFGISKTCAIKQLTQKQMDKIRKYIELNFITGTELRKKKNEYLRKLVNDHTYRGTRHKLGLPVRGQRSRSNGRTQKKRKIQVSIS